MAVFLVSPLLAYAFGLRGTRFVIVSALLIWPLGRAVKLAVNALLPPRVTLRRDDDPEIIRCTNCGTHLSSLVQGSNPIKCPQCGQAFSLKMGKGVWFLLVGSALWLFLFTPLASLLGYKLGMVGINLALLPVAVFLGGGAILNLGFKLLGDRIQKRRISPASPDPPPSLLGRTELKLNIWKHT